MFRRQVFNKLSVFNVFFVCCYSSAIYAEEARPIGSAGVQLVTNATDASAFCDKDYVQNKASLNNDDCIPLTVDHDWVKLSSNEWLKG